jgi:hypothetical protein
MTREDTKNTLVQTKLGLVEKYTRLAKVCKSRPKKQVLLNRVKKYRLQADDAARR